MKGEGGIHEGFERGLIQDQGWAQKASTHKQKALHEGPLAHKVVYQEGAARGICKMGLRTEGSLEGGVYRPIEVMCNALATCGGAGKKEAGGAGGGGGRQGFTWHIQASGEVVGSI